MNAYPQPDPSRSDAPAEDAEPYTGLDAVLDRRAAGAAGALAFADGVESLTYGGLRAESAALAGGLAQLGVKRGDRVALLLPAGLDFIRAFYALQRLAAVPCAFDPGVPAAIAARVRRPGAAMPGADGRIAGDAGSVGRGRIARPGAG